MPNREITARFPDPLLSDKLFDDLQANSANTNQADIEQRIAEKLYQYTDGRSPVYYQGSIAGENARQELGQFIQSDRFNTLKIELDSCYKTLRDWINAQEIPLVSARDSNGQEKNELAAFFERLQEDYYGIDLTKFYGDGKKYIEKIAIFIQDENIPLDFRKTQIINLLGDRGLVQCSNGCITRLATAASMLEDYGKSDSLDLIKIFTKRIAKVSVKALISLGFASGDLVSKTDLTIDRALCKVADVNFASYEIHAQNYLLERLKSDLGWDFLKVPDDFYTKVFYENLRIHPRENANNLAVRKKTIDDLYLKYKGKFMDNFQAHQLVFFIRGEFETFIGDKLRSYIGYMRDNNNAEIAEIWDMLQKKLDNFFGEERDKRISYIIYQPIEDKQLNGEELSVQEASIRPELTESLTIETTERLFEKNYFSVDLSTDSRLFSENSPFYNRNPRWRSKAPLFSAMTDDYHIYYSNLALSWIKVTETIDGEKQQVKKLIINLIKTEEGFNQVNQLFSLENAIKNIEAAQKAIKDLKAGNNPEAAQKIIENTRKDLDVITSLLQSSSDLNLFLENVVESKRFQMFEKLNSYVSFEGRYITHPNMNQFVQRFISFSDYPKYETRFFSILNKENLRFLLTQEVKQDMSLKNVIKGKLSQAEKAVQYSNFFIKEDNKIYNFIKNLIDYTGWKDFSGMVFHPLFVQNPEISPVSILYLINLDFSEADFTHTKFLTGVSECKFLNARFEDTEFSELSSSDFSNTDLAGTHFLGQVSFCNFNQADLSRISVGEKRFFGFMNTFMDARFSTESFFSAIASADISITITGADLSRVNFQDPRIKGKLNEFESVIFKEMNLQAQDLRELISIFKFEGVNLSYSNLDGCNFSKSRFKDTKVTGASIKDTVLTVEQLQLFYEQGHRDFRSSVLIDDYLYEDRFYLSDLDFSFSGAVFSQDIFKHLAERGFKNFQGVDLRLVSSKTLKSYVEQLQYDSNTKFPDDFNPFSASCSASTRRRRSPGACLLSMGDLDEEKLAHYNEKPFFNLDQLDGSTQALTSRLIEARQKGSVISAAELSAILLGMTETSNTQHKLIINDTRMKNIKAIHQILALAKAAPNQSVWLEKVTKNYPEVGALLKEQISELEVRYQRSRKKPFSFKHLKQALADETIVLYPFSFSEDPQMAQPLRGVLGGSEISAIYISDQEFRISAQNTMPAGQVELNFRDAILELSNPETEIYRRVSPVSQEITRYQGPQSEIKQAWTMQTMESFKTPPSTLPGTFKLQRTLQMLLGDTKAWVDSVLSNALLKKGDWIPILSTAEPIATHNEQITLVNRITQAEQIKQFSGRESLKFRAKLNRFLDEIKAIPNVLKFIVRDPEKAMRIAFNLEEMPVNYDSYSETETVDGLNAAFTIQAVMALVQKHSREQFGTENGPLVNTLQLHAYVNLVQVVHGTLLDVDKVITLVKLLIREENSIQKTLSTFSWSFKQFSIGGIGIALSMFNVGLDIKELTEARNAAEKTLFTTQLVLDSTNLALIAGSTAASFLGAAGASAALGGIGVITAGLGIGILGLVTVSNELAAYAENVGKYFYQIDQAYKYYGYKKEINDHNLTMMIPIPGAVISEIDFQKNEIHFASQYIYSSDVLNMNGDVANGFIIDKDHIFWYNPIINHDKTKAINIREALGYPQKLQLQSEDLDRKELEGVPLQEYAKALVDYLASTRTQKKPDRGSWQNQTAWLLPSTPIAYIDYEYHFLADAISRNGQGFDLLRKMENDHFFFDYMSNGGHIIYKIYPHLENTVTTIRLNAQTRQFFIPKFSNQDSKISNKIHYDFVPPSVSQEETSCYIYLNKIGGIQLHKSNVSFTWFLDSQALHHSKVDFTDEGIRVGGIPIRLAPDDQAAYILLNKDHSHFVLDLKKKDVFLKDIDFESIQKQNYSMKAYAQSKHLSRPDDILTVFHFNSSVIKSQFAYTGKAFYSPQEDHYFYTKDLPQEMLEDAQLVHTTSKASFYINPSLNVAWSTARDTHDLIRYYRFQKTLSPYGFNWVQANGVMSFFQSIRLGSNRLATAIYRLTEGGYFALDVIVDSNFWSALDRRDFDYLCDYSLLRPKALPIAEEKSNIADMRLIKILNNMNGTDSAMWLRKTQRNRYELINLPKSTIETVFLGSLMADAADLAVYSETSVTTEVFCFFTPPGNSSQEGLLSLQRKLELIPSLINSFYFTIKTLINKFELELDEFRYLLDLLNLLTTIKDGELDDPEQFFEIFERYRFKSNSCLEDSVELVLKSYLDSGIEKWSIIDGLQSALNFEAFEFGEAIKRAKEELGSILTNIKLEELRFIPEEIVDKLIYIERYISDYILVSPPDSIKLKVRQAFVRGSNLFIETVDGLLKQVDSLGKMSPVIGFSSLWMQAHSKVWQEQIPLVLEKNPTQEKLVFILGLSDITGENLIAWYNRLDKKFIFVQALYKQGTRLGMSFLGNIADHYFFLDEDKILYQKTVERSLNANLFNATHLQQTINPLVPQTMPLQQAYLHKKRVWLHTQNGLLFSFDPEQPQQWLLERIYPEMANRYLLPYQEKKAIFPFLKFLMENYTTFLLKGQLLVDSLESPVANLTIREIRQMPDSDKKLSYLQQIVDINYDKLFDAMCSTSSCRNYAVSNDLLFEISYALYPKEHSYQFSSSLVPIEQRINVTSYWDPQGKQFFNFPENVTDVKYLGETINDEACFFSSSVQKVYTIPGRSYLNRQAHIKPLLSTEFTFRGHDSLLLQIKNSISSLPLLKNVTMLNFQLSEFEGYLSLDSQAMNYYPIMTILARKDTKQLVLQIEQDVNNKVCARSAGQDIIISQSASPCKLILIDILSAETRLLKNSYLNFTHASLSFYEIRNRLLSLPSGLQGNIDIPLQHTQISLPKEPPQPAALQKESLSVNEASMKLRHQGAEISEPKSNRSWPSIVGGGIAALAGLGAGYAAWLFGRRRLAYAGAKVVLGAAGTSVLELERVEASYQEAPRDAMDESTKEQTDYLINGSEFVAEMETENKKLSKQPIESQGFESTYGDVEWEGLHTQSFANVACVVSLLGAEFKKRSDERFIKTDCARRIKLAQVQGKQIMFELENVVSGFIQDCETAIRKENITLPEDIVSLVVKRLKGERYKDSVCSISREQLSQKIRRCLQSDSLWGSDFQKMIADLFFEKGYQKVKNIPFSDIEELADKQKTTMLQIIPAVKQTEDDFLASLSLKEGPDYLSANEQLTSQLSNNSSFFKVSEPKSIAEETHDSSKIQARWY